MFNKKNVLILVITFVLYIYFNSGINYVPIEELTIPGGIGMDIIPTDEGSSKYDITISTYNYGTKPQTTSINISGAADSLGETRQTRQPKIDKKLVLGLEKIKVASEKAAKFGLEPWINIFFNNPNVNDTGYVVISKEKASEVLNFKIPGYAGASDYIDGIIRHSNEFNFFSENYKLIDLYIRMGSEGRNFVAPYLEIKNNELQITGFAIFKRDKMALKLDLTEGRLMNLLRENNVKGLLGIQETPKKYIDYNATSKRKVKCKKINDRYYFTINISLKGNIVNNLLYKDIFENPEIADKFKNAMSKQLENNCNKFIEKMQNEYKMDLLELGHIAAAKYGRKTGADWDKIVSESEIKVNVKTELENKGRGDYWIDEK